MHFEHYLDWRKPCFVIQFGLGKNSEPFELHSLHLSQSYLSFAAKYEQCNQNILSVSLLRPGCVRRPNLAEILSIFWSRPPHCWGSPENCNDSSEEDTSCVMLVLASSLDEVQTRARGSVFPCSHPGFPPSVSMSRPSSWWLLCRLPSETTLSET